MIGGTWLLELETPSKFMTSSWMFCWVFKVFSYAPYESMPWVLSEFESSEFECVGVLLDSDHVDSNLFSNDWVELDSVEIVLCYSPSTLHIFMNIWTIIII